MATVYTPLFLFNHLETPIKRLIVLPLSKDSLLYSFTLLFVKAINFYFHLYLFFSAMSFPIVLLFSLIAEIGIVSECSD